MTLNEIAYNIADASGRATNAAYIERLKFQIKYYRSLLIRRDQERNTYLPDQFIQTLEAPISIVNIAETIEFSAAVNNQPLHKSNSILPKPVRLKRGVPFFEVAYFKTVYTGKLKLRQVVAVTEQVATTYGTWQGSFSDTQIGGLSAGDTITLNNITTTSEGGKEAVFSLTSTVNAGSPITNASLTGLTITQGGSGYKVGDRVTLNLPTDDLDSNGNNRYGTSSIVYIITKEDIDLDSVLSRTKVPLIPITPGAYEYSYFTKFNADAPKYFYQNGRIYTLNVPATNPHLGDDYVLPTLFVRGIFEDVEELRSFTYIGEPCYNDDSAYPVTADMIQQITQSILAAEYKLENIQNDNNEIKVNE